ncbi:MULTISPECIES: hypothetical protein [Enterobacteriaceae]|uniref:hypothetical protein n=2 Tax=Enterobacterales TaxID=91347 RepID=UPI0005AB220C|nr:MULTISPECIES: hypothetical protein [Enterobacteriaceae]WPO97385.1 hypothetical protein SFA32_06675 [Buttiauxella sp. HR94]HAZ75378.1 hypothetical protein [Enterobacteriaceae bacterium]HBC81759.1 hypothetical protein [Escherichia sp.]MCR4458092.1 hypothetical protein [Pseudescherichia sp. L3]MDU5452451.1 hypothetical protein [Pseudescherichia vulneris]
MVRILRYLFTSPEKLLQVTDHRDVQESIDDGERIIIDEDGRARVNVRSQAVKEDFIRHVDALKRA